MLMADVLRDLDGTGIGMMFIPHEQHEIVTYAISDGEFVKIGRSRCIVARFNALQIANARPLKLIGVMIGDFETACHRGLDSLDARARGEWFELNEEVMSFLRDVNMVTSEAF